MLYFDFYAILMNGYFQYCSRMYNVYINDCHNCHDNHDTLKILYNLILSNKPAHNNGVYRDFSA